MTNKELISTHPDYINIKRFDYSLEKLLDRYPNGAPDRIIAQALDMTEDEMKELYQQALEKLKKELT